MKTKKFEKRIEKHSDIITEAVDKLVKNSYKHQLEMNFEGYLDDKNVSHYVVTLDIPIGKIK